MGSGNERTTEPQDAVLGIDPGSRRMGWAVVRPCPSAPNGLLRVDSGTLEPPHQDPLNARLGHMLLALEDLFARHRVTSVAVEQAYLAHNPHTALVLGQARGLPIALAAARGLEVAEYQASVVKQQVVGSGRAAKGQVRAMVQLLLQLPALPQEDEADALAVAIAHLRFSAVPLAASVPARVPAALREAQGQVPSTPGRDYYAAVVRAAGPRGGGRKGRRR